VGFKTGRAHGWTAEVSQPETLRVDIDEAWSLSESCWLLHWIGKDRLRDAGENCSKGYENSIERWTRRLYRLGDIGLEVEEM
jgi:hypothetical protein